MSEPADPAVIAALTEALKRDPESLPVRLHLAALLLPTDPATALEHYAVTLEHEPARLDALRGAAQAAAASGQEQRAEGYRRLLQALEAGGQPPAEAQSERGKEESG